MFQIEYPNGQVETLDPNDPPKLKPLFDSATEKPTFIPTTMFYFFGTFVNTFTQGIHFEGKNFVVKQLAQILQLKGNSHIATFRPITQIMFHFEWDKFVRDYVRDMKKFGTDLGGSFYTSFMEDLNELQNTTIRR